MTIGEKILQLRQERKMTQRELAEKLNVTDKTISRWETGVSLPDVQMLKNVADLFAVPISSLYDCVPSGNVNTAESCNYEKITQYKKKSIVACVLMIASIASLLLSIFCEQMFANDIARVVLIVFFVIWIALLLVSATVKILALVDLHTYSKTKYYRKQYNKAMRAYGFVYLGIFCAHVITFFVLAFI